MAQDPNKNAADDEAARREYIRATFGDDALEGLATDEPVTSQRRTADALAKEPMQAGARREQAEDLALVEMAAQEQEEDQALAKVLSTSARGKGTVTRRELRLAAQAARRQGHSLGSSAERLAGMAGPGQGWDAA